MQAWPACSPSQDPRLLSAEEFFHIEFGPDLKAELDNGVIRMMAGCARCHDRVQVNLLVALASGLRGSGFHPNGSLTEVRTHALSIRIPDVSVSPDLGSAADDQRDIIDDPKVIIEILAPGTEASDRGVKLAEYKALPSVDTIALVDPEAERLHVFQRVSHVPEAWAETRHMAPADLELPTLGLTIPYVEIFARD